MKNITKEFILPRLDEFKGYCKQDCPSCPSYKRIEKSGKNFCPVIYSIRDDLGLLSRFFGTELNDLSLKYTGNYDPKENMKHVEKLEKMIAEDGKHVPENFSLVSSISVLKVQPKVKRFFGGCFP